MATVIKRDKASRAWLKATRGKRSIARVAARKAPGAFRKKYKAL